MINIKKYAAIDIGSNAIRLLISNIIEQKGKPTLFKKSALVRVPIRLGADVFINQKIFFGLKNIDHQILTNIFFVMKI